MPGHQGWAHRLHPGGLGTRLGPQIPTGGLARSQDLVTLPLPWAGPVPGTEALTKPLWGLG